MRPPTPPPYRQALWERWGIGRRLPVAARMVLRSVARQPVKSSFSVIGIACGTSLLVTGNSLMDSMNFGIDTEFQRVNRQDATVQLFEVRNGARASSAFADLPGSLTVEPFRHASVRLRSGHRERRLSLEGIPRGRTLGQLLNTDLQPVEVPESGLLLSQKLADILGVDVGDTVTVEVLEGRRPVAEVPVTATIETTGAASKDKASLMESIIFDTASSKVNPDFFSSIIYPFDRYYKPQNQKFIML